MAAYERFQSSALDGVTLVTLADQHLTDQDVLGALRHELVNFVEQKKPPKLLVGFAQVVRCSSEAISILLRVRKLVGSYGGELRICQLPTRLREVFKLMRLEGEVFKIHDSPLEAVAEF